MMTIYHSLCPAISSGQKWWQIVLEISFMQLMRRLNMHSWLAQIFSFWGWGGWSYFFVFSPCLQCVLNMFSSCSYKVPQVPKLFTNTFPITPQFYSHVVLSKVQLSCLYTEKGRLKGCTFVSILQLGSKEVFLLKSIQCSKKNWWWANGCGFFKKKKKKLWTQPWTN
jgi:hypothetical protein